MENCKQPKQSESPKNFHGLASVQELTKDTTMAIPHRNVRVNELPEPAVLFDNKKNMPTVPTIDMTKFVTDFDYELEKLHSACKEWGIFQLVNHGVEASLLEKLKDEVETFYKLPMEDKMKFKTRPGEYEGYGNINLNNEQKLDSSDRFYIITNPKPIRKPYLFPQLPSSLRNNLETYLMELEKLAMKLLGMLAKAMKIEKKDLEELFEDGMESIRVTYYPPCSKPELVIGLTPHSDATGITIINQLNGVDGLQIKRDGLWLPLSFIPGAFVVNIGDILEILSNGMYKSIEHRGMSNSTKERISLAMFFNPKLDAEIGPIASLINPQNPPIFRKIGMKTYAQEFFSRRKLDGKSYLDYMRIQDGDI